MDRLSVHVAAEVPVEAVEVVAVAVVVAASMIFEFLCLGATGRRSGPRCLEDSLIPVAKYLGWPVVWITTTAIEPEVLYGIFNNVIIT